MRVRWLSGLRGMLVLLRKRFVVGGLRRPMVFRPISRLLEENS